MTVGPRTARPALPSGMANPDEILVEDLEVSVRTMGELLRLGAGTLAELLALPVIEVRTALSAQELRELFAELGRVVVVA